ncbi:hypothetical protein ABEG18_13145 [Alsobacter sp. KACC 23698]|uniref:Methyltransferase n=1 Tax=Alsobacter sp. KACC 23698 TaxID=3149229 RepID=A0AAU7J8X8_9HYPH
MNAPVKLNAHLWARHPDDWYVEPEWVSERLFAVERFRGTVLDPACGTGRIVRAAQMAGLHAWGEDIVVRSPDCARVSNFLIERVGANNVISNPPFKHAEAFVTRALEVAMDKVAMLLPSAWVHGDERSRWLESTPLRRVLFITPRPSMPPGPVIEAGIKAGGGTSDFAWFIWHQNFDGKPELGWSRRKP